MINNTARRMLSRIQPPPSQSAETEARSRAFIDALLGNNELFLDSASVGFALSGNPLHATPKKVASQARQCGQVFGAWDGSAYRYPRFQFDAGGQPLRDVPELIDLLPRDSDGSNRDAALWLFAPDAKFGGSAPADVFADDPQRVIAVARKYRDGDD